MENLNLQGHYELKAVVPESTCNFMEPQSHPEDEISAVDLRMTRSSSMVNSSDSKIDYYKNKRVALGMAHLFENVNANDLFLANVSSEPQVENTSENKNYTTISNIETYKDDHIPASHIHCTSNQKIDPQKKYTFKKICLNGPDSLNTEQNFDFVLLADQETQTHIKEFIDTSVQTDRDTNKSTCSLLKKRTLSNCNYSCLLCQRFYTTKSSYDRHVRTHITNVNVITNLHITKKGKFMIMGKNICKSPLNDFPLTLRTPNLTKYQCDICFKSFSSQTALDCHKDTLAIEQFPSTKCKECHVKFFTLGALLEHVNAVHERNTNECNSYCCIFCNESFESSYCFQLHLDEHVCTQGSI